MARPCQTAGLLHPPSGHSLSLSLPRRLGPIKAGLTCPLSLSPTPFIPRVSPGSRRGWIPAQQYPPAPGKEIIASLVTQMVNNPPAMRETWVGSLGWEDPLEKGIATQSSILAWRIPWTEEPVRLQSMGC